jgi:hypothetical protein
MVSPFDGQFGQNVLTTSRRAALKTRLLALGNLSAAGTIGAPSYR